MRPRGYVGVVGPGAATSEQVEQAVTVGRLLAEQGLVVVTGGLGGVMAGAARGCAQAGGTSLGLLPGDDRSAANPHLSVTIPTGLGEMRNALLVRACDAVVAVGHSWGTVSEIALAARTGVPVVLLDGLRLFDEVPVDGDDVRAPRHAVSPEDAVSSVLGDLGLETSPAREGGEPAYDGWVLGVDGARGGWTGALLPVSGAGTVRIVAGADLRTVIDRVDHGAVHVELVAVDAPIGLPDTGRRRADVEVRGRLGPRAGSVFATPVRDALAAESYAEARRISVARTGGTSLAAQSYAMRRAILDVDAYVRGEGPTLPVVEVHPELCFAIMAGAPLASSKKTPEGLREREGLLLAQGIRLPRDLDLGRRGADDVLDSAAAAWSAARVVRGEAVRHPAQPERFSDGIDAAIWV
ncbi:MULTISPECIES: TIGR00725 family protein [Arsenicicoccus]|uniref:TIGR00725 family protein n=1 Tax=Arsenicicoccus TaxID=267408 RepID=UPI00257C78AA|nr:MULTISPECIES: TIGR00725 family protein [Arsenicicoccus]